MSLQLKTGPVIERDQKLVRVRIELSDQGGIASPWLRVPQRRAAGTQDVDLPDLQEVVDALIDSDGSEGVVLGSTYGDDATPPVTDGDKRVTKYPDGTVFSYDRAAHKFILDVAGSGALIEIRSAGDVKVEATGTATIQCAEADVKASGTANVDGAIISLAGGGPPVARVGDMVAGPYGPIPIIGGSSKVFAGG